MTSKAERKAWVVMASLMRSGESSMTPRCSRRSRACGFTYVAALILVALTGLALAITGQVWSFSRQRQKEAELLWIGNQFSQAIGIYYQRSPGTVKRYPNSLEELLEDSRYVSLERYLRKMYADPMTGKTEWGTVPAPGGGIMGVHSLSTEQTIRQSSEDGQTYSQASGQRYVDWQFVYEPPVKPATGPNGRGR